MKIGWPKFLKTKKKKKSVCHMNEEEYRNYLNPPRPRKQA